MSFLQIDTSAIDFEDTIFVVAAALFTSLLSEGMTSMINVKLLE